MHVIETIRQILNKLSKIIKKVIVFSVKFILLRMSIKIIYIYKCIYYIQHIGQELASSLRRPA